MSVLKWLSQFMDPLLPLYFLIAACAIEIPAWLKRRKEKRGGIE